VIVALHSRNEQFRRSSVTSRFHWSPLSHSSLHVTSWRCVTSSRRRQPTTPCPSCVRWNQALSGSTGSAQSITARHNPHSNEVKVKVKVKVGANIPYRLLICHIQAMSLQVKIPLLSVTHSQCDASPKVRLPSRLRSVTVLWPLPNYTAWW